MGLKGDIHYLGRCLTEERRKGKLARLAGSALDLGLRRVDRTRGHMMQAFGAAQMFLAKYPEHAERIRAASPNVPYRLSGVVLNDWLDFFDQKTGAYGQPEFGYNWDTLRGYLTPGYGGDRVRGGGGDNEFEIALRLVAAFS